MKPSGLGLATGILMVLAGSVWILQGLDVAFAPQSFMTNNRWWVSWGILAVVVGVFLVVRYVKSRR
jgi:uncharacterized membrane protein HdeD (DUF308 family)